MDRIYYSKTSNAWHFEQDDGSELAYDAAKNAWVPLVWTRRLESASN